MPQIQILYWRQIPAQVRVFDGRRPLTEQLPDRFQQHIDRIAMREGLAGTDEYLAQWNWSSKQECEGDAQQLLRQTVDQLIADHDPGTQEPEAQEPDARDTPTLTTEPEDV